MDAGNLVWLFGGSSIIQCFLINSQTLSNSCVSSISHPNMNSNTKFCDSCKQLFQVTIKNNLYALQRLKDERKRVISHYHYYSLPWLFQQQLTKKLKNSINTQLFCHYLATMCFFCIHFDVLYEAL